MCYSLPREAEGDLWAIRLNLDMHRALCTCNSCTMGFQGVWLLYPEWVFPKAKSKGIPLWYEYTYRLMVGMLKAPPKK